MSNTFTGNYADGAALTKAMLDTAYQTLQLDVANTALTTTGSTTGQALISNGSGIAASFQTIPDPQGPFSLRNYGLKATVASGIMTVTLTTKAGTAPSASDLVNFNYSTAGTTSATYATVNVASATTVALNASASLGFNTTSTVRIFIYGYYNTAASAVKLAIAGRPDLDRGEIITTVALSASADSGAVLYATAALSVAPRLLGWAESAHNSGGSWQTPSRVTVNNNSNCSKWVNYTPTITSNTTVSSSSISTAQFMIENQICHVYIAGTVKMGTTAGSLYFTLPTAQTVFLEQFSLRGTGGSTGGSLIVRADYPAGGSAVYADGITNFSTSTQSFSVGFTYRI